jgi:16S rRNA (adenine1518-N6/adenine1519-N6)-dimethyltransferase
MRKTKPEDVEDEAMFFRVVRASFAQRRKTLVNSLLSAFGDRLAKDALTELLAGCGAGPLVRGETLGIPEFARIARVLGARLR